MIKTNACHLDFNHVGNPMLVCYDEEGNIIGDVVRSFPEGSPRGVSLGITDCGAGRGDFYELMIGDKIERFCNLNDALREFEKRALIKIVKFR